MKQLLVISILLSLLAAQLGSLIIGYGSPIIHALCYGKVFKRRSDSNNSLVFRLDSAALAKAHTEEQELEIDGMRFDIISMQSSGDQVLIHAYKDENETNLLRILAQVRKAVRQASGKHPAGKNLSTWLFKLYCPNQPAVASLSLASSDVPVSLSNTPRLLKDDQSLPGQPPDVNG